MQLRVARLCLDCEEIHDGQQCPVCASETFAFLSRWVPTPERRSSPRPAAAEAAPPAPPPAAKKRGVMVGVGVLGAVAFALARVSNAARKRLDDAASRQVTGELK